MCAALPEERKPNHLFYGVAAKMAVIGGKSGKFFLGHVWPRFPCACAIIQIYYRFVPRRLLHARFLRFLRGWCVCRLFSLQFIFPIIMVHFIFASPSPSNDISTPTTPSTNRIYIHYYNITWLFTRYVNSLGEEWERCLHLLICHEVVIVQHKFLLKLSRDHE